MYSPLIPWKLSSKPREKGPSLFTTYIGEIPKIYYASKAFKKKMFIF